MVNKIDPTILKTVNTFGASSKLIDCVVFANNFMQSRYLLEKLHKLSDVSEFPFINAFGVKLNFNEINKIAALNSVNYITSSLKVQTQVNIAREVINLAPSNIKHNFSCVVIDTGVSLGIDVCIPRNKIIEFVDFVNNKNFPYGIKYND